MTETPGCGRTRALIPELAAGVAAGDERARALEHLAHCALCRHELDTMSEVVDELISLAPAAEPPDGFATSVLARLAPRPRRQRWRRLVAVVVIAAAAAGTSWQATLRSTPQVSEEDQFIAQQYRKTLAAANGKYLTAAPIRQPGGAIGGRAFGYEGNPSWVFVTIASGMPTGPCEVRLLARDGTVLTIGTMHIDQAGGSWGTAVRLPIHHIAEIRLSLARRPDLVATFPLPPRPRPSPK